MTAASNDPDTRGERRERKQEKKKHALRMHGASIRRIYRDAVLKRVRRGTPKSDAGGDSG